MFLSEPTNQELELADEISALRQRMALAREGLLPWHIDQVKFYERPAKAALAHNADQSMSMQFHIPSTRPLRLTNAKGASSFYFSHRPISKTAYAKKPKNGQPLTGAARAHGQYIEREAVLAIIGEFSVEDQRASIPPSPLPTIQEYQYESTDQSGQPTYNRDLVAEFTLFESSFASDHSINPIWGDASRATKPDADLCLLPSINLVCDGWRPDSVLLGAEDVSLCARTGRQRLRFTAPGDRIYEKHQGPPALKSASELARHDAYIDRPKAVAEQPNGERALITNIDKDPTERAKFWALVEQHEAEKNDDQMTVRIADAPVFWSEVLVQPDCPPDLRTGLNKAEPSDPHKFTISSGPDIRKFLQRQPGWVPFAGKKSQSSGTKPLAEFHDGRGGRIQYRTVGELPNELTIAERFALLREFANEFEKRNLPFVAVMHAPDHSNDKKNWHFHLIYYDRPCSRITQNDIEYLAAEGFRSDHLKPGDWDFAVVTPKKGRSNGKAVPLRRNKVAAVAHKGWPKYLRKRLATITNKHLQASGISRCVDARRYADMDIPAEPQEHLGTANAALENRGVATLIGSDNEMRQWKAIRAQADAQLEQSLRSFGLPRPEGSKVAEAKRPLTESERLLTQSAHLEHQAFLLDHELERVYSRAKNVRQKNQRLLDASQDNAQAVSQQQRNEAQHLVDAASAYIRELNAELGPSVWLPETMRSIAKDLRIQAMDEQILAHNSQKAAQADPDYSSSKRANTEILLPRTSEDDNQHQQLPTKSAEPDLPVPDKSRPMLVTTEKTVDDAAKRASMQAAIAAARGMSF